MCPSKPCCSTTTDCQPPAPCTDPCTLHPRACCRYLEYNKLVGLVPALPFAQYTSACCLQDGGSNHFDCPLPQVRALCWCSTLMAAGHALQCTAMCDEALTHVPTPTHPTTDCSAPCPPHTCHREPTSATVVAITTSHVLLKRLRYKTTIHPFTHPR